MNIANANAIADFDNDRKSKQVSVSSLKCNNINVNVNGLELDVFPPFLADNSGLAAEAVEGNTDPSWIAGNGGNGEGSQINDFRFICINNNNNTIVENQSPEPLSDPIITVKKEMLICDDPNIQQTGTIGGFPALSISCTLFDETIPGPDSAEWVQWDGNCTASSFCPFFNEENYTMQIAQNSDPDLIEFPGTSEGQSVNVQSGTYQITEEHIVPASDTCVNSGFGDRQVDIIDYSQDLNHPQATFCFTLEGDCFGTIQAGEEKLCTIKNYLVRGAFLITGS
ncbi:MAG: hypothetical protein AB7F53_08360 [Nitrososphaeraceae archaeon]